MVASVGSESSTESLWVVVARSVSGYKVGVGWVRGVLLMCVRSPLSVGCLSCACPSGFC